MTPMLTKQQSFQEEFEGTNSENYHRIRDHYHYAGKFRGAAHSLCDI